MSAADPATLAFAQALGHHVAGRTGPAILAYRRLVAAVPGHADAWCNLASLLVGLGRLDEARTALERSLHLAPQNPVARCVEGDLLLAEGQPHAAEAAFRASLALDAGSVLARSHLAALLQRLDQPEEALRLDEEALALEPRRPELRLNHGFGLLRLGRLEEAATRFQALLEENPAHPQARWNLAYARLLQGRWAEAWPHFHARLEVPEAAPNLRAFPQPRWDGSPLGERTLLVWGEQGYGDALQFARYLPHLKRLAGGRILYLGYPALRPLLEPLPGLDAFLEEGQALPPFDLQIPLLELPALFGTTPDTVPPVPYLEAPPGELPAEAARMLAPGTLRVGLAWCGSTLHAEDRRRSLDPGQLAPLRAWGDVRFFSLQVGARALPPLPGLQDLSPFIRNFGDTARLLQRLDLVLSVDTSVAHLAGALGLPTLLLLPHFPDWRWGWEGEGTPWYPTLQLFRQPTPGDWDAVLAQVGALA